jgi:two-component system cell cycle response regulator
MNVKVLISDSNDTLRGWLREALSKRGYEVFEASDESSALVALGGENAPRLAVLDANAGGVRVCEQTKTRPDEAYIVLAGTREQKDEIRRGIEAGADEYLFKPMDPMELEMRIRGSERLLESQQVTAQAERKLDYQIRHDPMTGAWNRAAVVDALWRELARGRRRKTPVGVLLVGLDGLKQLNGREGYGAGDDALRNLARRLSGTVRPYDTIGRYTGDVFVIITPECDEADATKQAQRLQAAITQDPIKFSVGRGPTRASDQCVLSSLSIGVAAVQGATEPDLLLRAAEAALGRARSYGNRVESATLFMAATLDKAA